MSRIGNFGKSIVFQVSDKKVFTFNKLSNKVSGQYSDHPIMGRKSKSEFTGADLRTVSLEISLNAMHGVNPRKILQTLEKIVETGQAEKLVIGGKKVGKNQWVITEISETWDEFLSKGELLKATVSLTLQEYL